MSCENALTSILDKTCLSALAGGQKPRPRPEQLGEVRLRPRSCDSAGWHGEDGAGQDTQKAEGAPCEKYSDERQDKKTHRLGV